MQHVPEWTLEQWNVNRLRVNPLQHKHFRARTQQEMDELEFAVRQNFLEPLDVLPDGIILAGHQRLQLAIERLKLKIVPVRVRYDLHAQGPVACELFFLQNNRASRQLTPLEIARSYERTVELETHLRKSQDPSQRPKGRVRELVAKQFGMSRRAMDEWCKILHTPRLIQEEVELKRLSLTEAIAISRASAEDQQQIADLIGQGVQARKAMRKVIGVLKRGPLGDDQLTRRWRDFGRVAFDLAQTLPHSLDAILANQHRRLGYAIEVADSLRTFLASRSDASKAIENAGETSSTPAHTAAPVQQPTLNTKPKLLPTTTPPSKSAPAAKPKLFPRPVWPPNGDDSLGSAS